MANTGLIVPFIVDAIDRGVDMNGSHFDVYNSQLSNPESVSKESGTLLALFSVGIIVGSLAFGYLGKNHISNATMRI